MRKLAAFALMSIVAIASAQQANVPAKATLTVAPAAVKAGTKVNALLTLTFAEGLHGYQNPPSDEFQIPVVVKLKSGPAKLITVRYPKGEAHAMGGDPKPAMVYSGTVKIPIVLQAKSSGTVVLTVSYQQCTESSCFPPAETEAKVALKVTGKAKG